MTVDEDDVVAARVVEDDVVGARVVEDEGAGARVVDNDVAGLVVVEDEVVCSAAAVEEGSVDDGEGVEAPVVDGDPVVSGRPSVSGGPVVVGCDVDTGTLGSDALVDVEPPAVAATAVEPVATESATESPAGGVVEVVDGAGSAAAVGVTAASVVTFGTGAAVSGDSCVCSARRSRIAATTMPAKATAIRAFSTGRAIFQPLGNGSTEGVPRSGYGFPHTYRVLTNNYLSRSHPKDNTTNRIAGAGPSALRQRQGENREGGSGFAGGRPAGPHYQNRSGDRGPASRSVGSPHSIWATSRPVTGPSDRPTFP